MDIRAKDLLSKIRKIEGCENAVIAGGFVRDTILGGTKADVDIFVPSTTFREFDDLCFNSIDPIFKGGNEKKRKRGGYIPIPIKMANYGTLTGVRGPLLGKYDTKFQDFDVDIMGYNLPNDDNFGEAVINTFHFGIDRAYYDGFTIIEDDKFQADKANLQVTLLFLDDAKMLPASVNKFCKFKAKYPQYNFNTNILKLKTEEELEAEKKSKNLYLEQSMPAYRIDDDLDFEDEDDWENRDDFEDDLAGEEVEPI